MVCVVVRVAEDLFKLTQCGFVDAILVEVDQILFHFSWVFHEFLRFLPIRAVLAEDNAECLEYFSCYIRRGFICFDLSHRPYIDIGNQLDSLGIDRFGVTHLTCILALALFLHIDLFNHVDRIFVSCRIYL